MSDLIDRKAAIDVIDKIFPADPMRNEYTKGITCGAALAMEYIKQLPSAEPKKGRWTVQGEPPMYVIECSCCGQKYFNHVGQSLAKYCSNCGAKMEEME